MHPPLDEQLPTKEQVLEAWRLSLGHPGNLSAGSQLLVPLSPGADLVLATILKVSTDKSIVTVKAEGVKHEIPCKDFLTSGIDCLSEEERQRRSKASLMDSILFRPFTFSCQQPNREHPNRIRVPSTRTPHSIIVDILGCKPLCASILGQDWKRADFNLLGNVLYGQGNGKGPGSQTCHTIISTLTAFHLRMILLNPC